MKYPVPEHIAKCYLVYKRALKRKELINPRICSKCGSSDKVCGHHKDYEKPLEVVWLCNSCHGKTHPFKHSEKSKEMIRNSKKGVKFSQQHRTNMSLCRKGKNHSQEMKNKISITMKKVQQKGSKLVNHHWVRPLDLTVTL